MVLIPIVEQKNVLNFHYWIKFLKIFIFVKILTLYIYITYIL